METKDYDEGMLTFEDRYPLTTQPVNENDEEYAIAQEECNCPRLGIFNQHHYDYCPMFEDNSH